MPLKIAADIAEFRRQWFLEKMKEWSLTAEKVAEAMSADPSTVCNWRTGKYGIKEKTFEALKEFFRKIEFSHSKKSIRPFRR